MEKMTNILFNSVKDSVEADYYPSTISYFNEKGFKDFLKSKEVYIFKVTLEESDTPYSIHSLLKSQTSNLLVYVIVVEVEPGNNREVVKQFFSNSSSAFFYELIEETETKLVYSCLETLYEET